MKKLFVILLVLILSGCSAANSYSHLENGKDVLFTGPDNITYTRDDLYKSLKVSAPDSIVSDILNRIAMKSSDIVLDDVEKDADELISAYIESGLEPYIIQTYGSVEAYRSAYISSQILGVLAKLYVEENYDELIKDKSPIKMQLASFVSLEDAEKCIEDVNNGSTFDMAAVNNNSISTAESAIYTDDDTTLELEVKDYLNSSDATGLSGVITHTVTTTNTEGVEENTDNYYVVNVQSRNPEDFKDDLIAKLSNEVEGTTITDYFFSKHQFSIYDQDVYEILSSQYEVFK